MIYDIFSSSMGDILVATDGKAITTFGFVGQKYQKAIPTDWTKDAKQVLLKKAKQQAAEYFSGKRKTFDLPLSPNGTQFQKNVWDALLTIPYGKTTSYGKLAEQINNPKAVRAVGSAIGRNPICIVIPCHRVVGANNALTGYVGGVDRKQSLLEVEGIVLH